ncbi:hypothetical protein F4777DRAFT_573256 [Nemania sp. FL0916]|nr:hypothetical protein F4777DRAFT_573256 [Nemania sp. FL0916]
MAAVTDFVPTPTTLPASITSPPTIQFTPPPACNDPANNWVVTTSCYLELPHTIAYPDWLTCTVSQFGNPTDLSCDVPLPTESPSYLDAPKVTIDGVVSYYASCPSGYSTARVASYPGYYTWDYTDVHFDATEYNIGCCPTQYNFDIPAYSDDPRQHTITQHDGTDYSLFIYPLPGCAATSISQLSGKEIPAQTWSNTQPWDKRQAQTISWDYEHGTIRKISFDIGPQEDGNANSLHNYPNGQGGTPGPWPESTVQEVTPTPTPETTPIPEPTSEPEPTSAPISTPELESTSDITPTEYSTTVLPAGETPEQSSPSSETDASKGAAGTPAPVSQETDNTGSASPSLTTSINSSGNGPSSSPSTGTPIPLSGALGAVVPSLSAAFIISVAVMMI